jgi:hypothetical protein
MKCAMSARMFSILGATLIAHTLPIAAYGSTMESHGSGIDQADVLGIDQADVLGIDQADLLGIDQADLLGIDQADVLGIDQADLLGIDQADVLGIDRGMLVLVGSVESIDTENGVFRSVGQIISADTRILNVLAVGDLVSVEGSIAGPGWLYADAVTVSSDAYVAGSTEVFVTGIVSSVDASTGTATLGGLKVDYTSGLALGDAPNGVVWTFRGTQPNDRGVMISDDVDAALY